MSTQTLLDAVRAVKANERKASDSYAEAAQTIHSKMGKMLFEQLSQFEQFHYERLTALEKSLEEKGNFIEYEGKEFPMPPVFDIKAAEEPNKKSIITIISEALNLEQQAEKAYASLAAQYIDPEGHDMFIRLSKEEKNHYRILMEAYWSLTNLGVWKWSSV